MENAYWLYLKNTHQFPHTAKLYSLSVSVLAPVSSQKKNKKHSVPIGQLAYAWASTAHHVSSWLCHVFGLQLASPLPWALAWIM